MLVHERANALDFTYQSALHEQICLESSKQCAIFIKNRNFWLLLNSDALFGQPMGQRILINLFAMSAAQKVMNIKTCLTNYIAKCEDVTVVRFGSHCYSFLSVLFFLFCALCAFLWLILS